MGSFLALNLAAQVNVTSFGARGDGVTDDSAAVQAAINATPPGATLNFGGPKQIYLLSRRLLFQPNRIYQGQATLRMSPAAPAHTAIGKFAYTAANNITISGLTFDANGVGGGLQIAVDGAAAVPAVSIQISNSTFRNTTQSPSGPWDGAIFDPVGLLNSQIVQNQIINCSYGIYITNPGGLTISDNTFQTVHRGDAISITYAPAPFAYGVNVQILRNSGQHLGRMGVEIWPSGGNSAQSSVVQGNVISDNTFSDWDSGYDPEPFGISIMAGQNMIIQNNKLINGILGYGIEMGAPGSTVTQNTVQGFPTGIVLHDSHGSTVDSNLLIQQTVSGIELSNAPGSRAALNITNNRVMNPQSYGIFVNASDWGGSNLNGNSIWRAAGAFPADNTAQFTGISITPPSTPVVVMGNSVTQSATGGPSGFGFIGIRVNGNAGSNAGSSYQNNIVLSKYKFPQSYGLFGNSTGTLNGTIVQGNIFEGLAAASAGAGSANVTNGAGNLIDDCLQLGPIPLNP